MKKKTIILVVAAIMLFTFSSAPSAHAGAVFLAPAVGIVIWGVTAVVSGISAVVNETNNHQEDQREVSVQDQKADSEITPAVLELQQNAG